MEDRMGGGRKASRAEAPPVPPAGSVWPDLWCIQILVYNWHSIMVFCFGRGDQNFYIIFLWFFRSLINAFFFNFLN